MAKIAKTNIKRSRKGCLSCKKLRIKCTEEKPACEYCVHTSRECVYPLSCQVQSAPDPEPVAAELTASPISETVDHQSRFSSKGSTISHTSDAVHPADDSDRSTASPTSLERKTDMQSSLTTDSCHLVDTVVVVQPHQSGLDSNQPSEVDRLMRNLMLTQASTLLGISRFELRLLKFFDEECAQVFSYGISREIYDAWKYKVPPLFLESSLVRQSIFSFAALGLSTRVDLRSLQKSDNGINHWVWEKIAPKKFSNLKSSLPVSLYDAYADNGKCLYVKTTNYFLQALSKSRQKLSEATSLVERDLAAMGSFENPVVAKELVVSSILMFTFLGTQPHGLIKLISFDESESDFISIAAGCRDTIANYSNAVLQSDSRGFLYFKVEEDQLEISLKECEYPVIMDLVHHLNDSMGTEISGESSHITSTLQTAIASMARALVACSHFKMPIPVFRFIMILSDDMKHLLHSKHAYASRILYVYSCLCSIARLQMFEDHNIWRDYILWYQGEAVAQNWAWYQMDEALYVLVIKKHFQFLDFANFAMIDPVALRDCDIDEDGELVHGYEKRTSIQP
ncbi:uncharacterized protein LODBEIA_P42080 [Lodderomyces beijingensis]|uniref:Zn(2)-C6 fungal-type domain-containing protein n=1 Tax=Lodderomyces beijingensis TaxID=1775926 RepID=A0ABP0ZPB1_9ASCO